MVCVSAQTMHYLPREQGFYRFQVESSELHLDLWTPGGFSWAESPAKLQPNSTWNPPGLQMDLRSSRWTPSGFWWTLHNIEK